MQRAVLINGNEFHDDVNKDDDVEKCNYMA
jgi:hypothetical protein